MYDSESQLEGAGYSPLCLSISGSPRESNAPPPTSSTYFSFPSPTSGRSPTLPTFRVPKYGYYNIEGESPTASSPMDLSVTSSPRSDRKSSVLRAFIQSINFFMGIGVLALPYALRMTGWFGLVLLVLFGSVMTYTALLFGKNRRKFILENFSDHIEFAFPTKGRVLVSFIFYSSLLLNSALFLLLLANAATSCTGLAEHAALTVATVLYIVVANVCTSHSTVVMRWISIIGTFATVVLMVLLLTAEILALVQMHTRGAQVQMQRLNFKLGTENRGIFYGTERVYWTDFKACLNTLGVFGYCYMGHEVFPAIFHNMKHPSRYGTVVYIAFSTMFTSYALIAALGYLAYGSHSAGNIMDNLPPGEPVTLAVQGCIILTSITKIALSTAPLAEGLLEWAHLGIYLVSHSSYLAHLVAQAPRRMPRLRLDRTTHGVIPSHTASASTYGTYDLSRTAGVARSCTDSTTRIGAFTPPQRAARRTEGTSSAFVSPASTALTTQSKLSPLRIERQPHRDKYFSSPSSSGTRALEDQHRKSGGPEETKELIEKSIDLPREYPIQKLSALEIQPPVLRPQPCKSSLHRPHHTESGSVSTPRRGLTWSDTIPVPPIRSPSCENISLVLSSSSGGSVTGAVSDAVSSIPGILGAARADSFGGASSSMHSGASSDTGLPHSFMSYQQQSHTVSAIPTQQTGAVDLADLLSPSSSEDSTLSAEPHDAVDSGYETEETPQTRQRLYEDFSQSVDTRRLSCASDHSEVSTSDKLYHYLLDTILPVVMRTLLPVAAMGITLLFTNFVSMLVFIGGVYGGSVSIVIPAWSYYSIHYHEITSTEKYLLSAVLAFGTLLTVATIAVFVL